MKTNPKRKNGLKVPRIGRPHLPRLTKEERGGLRAVLRHTIEWANRAEARFMRSWKRTREECYYQQMLYYRHGAAFARGMLGRIEYWLRHDAMVIYDPLTQSRTTCGERALGEAAEVDGER